MDIPVKLIECIIDEAQRLTDEAPTEDHKHAEFLMKMTTSTLLGSIAQILIRARSH